MNNPDSRNSVADIAKKTGLLDMIQSRSHEMSQSSTSQIGANGSYAFNSFQSNSRATNETASNDFVFKVPGVPVLQPVRKPVQWNFQNCTPNSHLYIIMNMCKDLLNTLNSMHCDNEHILINVYKDLSMNMMKHIQQMPLERTISSNMSTTNDVSMESTSNFYNQTNQFGVINHRPKQSQYGNQFNHYDNRRFFENREPVVVLQNIRHLNANNQFNGHFDENRSFIESERPFSRSSPVLSVPKLIRKEKPTNNFLGKKDELKKFPLFLDSYLSKTTSRANDKRENLKKFKRNDTENMVNNSLYSTLGLRENVFQEGIFSESDIDCSIESENQNNQKLSKKCLDFSLNESMTLKENNSLLNKRKAVKKPVYRVSMNNTLNRSISKTRKHTSVYGLKNWMVVKNGSNNYEVFGNPVLPDGTLGNLSSAGTVISRISKNTIKTSSGKVVLTGTIKNNTKMHPVVRSKFIDGFPAQWRKILNDPDSV